MSKASIVISLDFELHWGRFDKYRLEDYQGYYKTTLAVIPKILDLFERYQIRATWATVGMLMAENWEEWNHFAPSRKPDFHKEKYSAYTWGQQSNSASLPGLFAPDQVKMIASLAGQELASHTFSHFYTGEKGSSLEAFESDLLAAKAIAKSKFGLDVQSLVFPRNQYHSQVLEIAAKSGFKAARTNPSDWFWQETSKENLLKKVFRTGDTLFPMGSPVTFDLEKCTIEPLVQIPSSRLLRPYRENSIFNKLRIERIISEIDSACKLKKAYHLWWHPHNFGHCPNENLNILEELLIHIHNAVEGGELESLSMRDVSQRMLEGSPDRKKEKQKTEIIKIVK
ncbi:Polysaccharide deacetylase [Algoriphagus locisalis]|uniref:Polysaccharide deacetylase n=1 Tax=Algoriphagus locisalis TaxID=305507 RepID=A0A1I6XW19_9BACT|nr:polysaccharide deacetylase family protein [Algoriphagus locisalis]SFT42589.1 Polysaccharide deacetylase [Algoriphagus locisalis]